MRLNTIRFNTGSIFYRPYQSDAATLRHFLIANMGIPYSYTEVILRRQVIGFGIIDRIKKLQHGFRKKELDEFLGLPSQTNRQCPQCAVDFYHCDLFNLQWLSECPIHCCAFTEYCPACKQSWPNKRELPKRECRVCGLFNFEATMPPIEMNPNLKCYETISTIIDFISHKMASPYFLGGHDFLYDYCWWSTVDINHRIFPTYQFARCNIMTKQELKAMGIVTIPIRKKSIQLLRSAQSTPPCRKELSSDTLENLDTSERYHHYSVFKLILNKIYSCTGKSHPFQITSYRHLGMKNLIKGPSPCPLCMALSLWFFHTASWDYKPRYHIGAAAYPFTSELGYDEFYPPFRGEKISIYPETFYVTQSFSSWTYKRSLELSFVDIFKFIAFLCKKRQYYQARDYKSYSCENYASKNRQFDDLDYLVDYQNKHAVIYYENEHPINHITCHMLGHSSIKCHNYHQYLQSIMDVTIQFKVSINPTNFDYRDCLELHQKFVKFVQFPYFQYARGSSPIRD